LGAHIHIAPPYRKVVASGTLARPPVSVARRIIICPRPSVTRSNALENAASAAAGGAAMIALIGWFGIRSIGAQVLQAVE
jgi:hypothetical protein